MADIAKPTNHTYHGITKVFASWISRAKTIIEKRRVYRKTHDSLQRLSDTELKDIGLTRSDITRIARESAVKRHGWY